MVKCRGESGDEQGRNRSRHHPVMPPFEQLSFKLVLRKVGSAQVRWESPLAALQPEGAVVVDKAEAEVEAPPPAVEPLPHP